MTMAFPPRRPPLGGWLALALVLGLLGSPGLPVARAQDDAKAEKGKNKGSDKAKPDDNAKGKAAADDDEKDDDDDKPAAPPGPPQAPDRFEDPRAEAALPNTFPELPTVKTSGDDKTLVDQLARGQGNLDLGAIDRFVRNRASELTRHSHIKALTEPAAKGGDPKGLEKAARELMGPLLVPANAANAGFRREYVKKLVDAFDKIWAGHLHSRTFAMIVLSRSGEAGAVPTFTAQLNNPDQLAVVKLLAAVGITNVAQNGKRDVEDAAGIPAAKALADFLRREPDTFWPAQFRALEALGSLRLATDQARGSKAEFAAVALELAADPKAAPAVRAWAGWALGMMRVPQSVRNYNYPLVANVLGGVAADLGEKIAALPDNAQPKVVQLIDLLLQIHLGIAGDPDVRASGLANASHPSIAAAQPYVAEVDKRVKAVTKAAIDLSNSAKGTQMKGRRAALSAAVEELRSFLAKPLNNGRVLFAGAEPLPVPAVPKVADGGRR
jgi:hypothetical protein